MDYDFQKVLEKSIMGADEKIDRKELIVIVFKTYIAKLLEVSMQKAGGVLRFEVIKVIRDNLINEFRKASLDMYQLPEEKYSDIFDETMEEILTHAGGAHDGEDIVQEGKQVLDINAKALMSDKGLKKTDAGILLPNKDT